MARSHPFLDMGVAVLVLAVLLLAGLVFGVAAVSVGHGSALSDTSPDRRAPLLPGRRIAPHDVQALEFTMAVRGYRMDEVDAVLDRLAAELSLRDAELGRLRSGPDAGDGAAPGARSSVSGSAGVESGAALWGAGPVSSRAPEPLPAPVPEVPAYHPPPAPDPSATGGDRMDRGADPLNPDWRPPGTPA